MKFDMFYEVQLARPWPPDHERVLYRNTLEQARLADRLDFSTWWQVEHNATPEFSYSSAPDLWLAAVALNTRRMRIGHSGIIGRHRVNHPLRIAARTATLDIISEGRLDVGLAVSGGKEWASFGADPATSAEEYQELFEMLPLMWTQSEFEWRSPHVTVAGLRGIAGLSGYCASKGAVRLFTKAVALECAQSGNLVRVNSVHPGAIETPIWAKMSHGGSPPADAQRYREAMEAARTASATATPLGHAGSADDVAAGVVFLASDEARFITGTELVIDGGVMAG